MNQRDQASSPRPHGMSRDDAVARLADHEGQPWDLIVIGGGATGVSVALDAATRGMDVVLVERSDFGKGTSSRSTKLVHGGVRYLQQGNVTLVRDALRERSLLRRHAPHVVRPLDFVIPCENYWSRFYYWFGLKLYDWLGRGKGFASSHGVSALTVANRLPTLSDHGHRGGVIYQDGQFDDTELLIDIASSACHHGVCLINYMNAESFHKDESGRITGIQVRDLETDQAYAVQGRAVVNATGPFCDQLRNLDDPVSASLVATSQGVHITLPRKFFPGETALIVPKTSDGRVLFLIPWHNHVLVGTTDTAIDEPTPEPHATSQEIDFLLTTAGEYLRDQPTRNDVLSVFTGIRPLVKDDPSARTASLSRDHKIVVATSGLITITGGKWTTVRKMGEDVVDRVLAITGIHADDCRTTELPIPSSQPSSAETGPCPILDSNLPYTASDVRHAVNQQMARTVEDVLARRTRALLLNASAAIQMAPQTAEIMAEELGRDVAWRDDQVEQFNEVAQGYRC